MLAGLVFAGFVALGSWQVKRLFWKLDLIARVDQRVHAAPVAVPGPGRWAAVTADSDEYRHVSLAGHFLYQLTTRVQATTELGGGFWLLTPLCMADGYTVLVNRGFVPGDIGAPPNVPHPVAGSCAQAAGTLVSAPLSTISGLLRISEPGGAYLRHNDPANNRWYSRDVAAIASAHQLTHVAPYFVDADAKQVSAGAPDAPTGGLTVISFHNNHLVYALTWYALALMIAGAVFWVVRQERRSRLSGKE
ncbi:SURF1 family protein [Janthinobacterium agaricidamnosum NBRC 102515 = DSM 9628]|uniref:SURF1-like protein n=2 Tax=Janthinobacterium agaricidamnosum TaxID=55508 RepID=W0V2B0_9BURK|nr:SURF1 family protein [Janthinobacterium agaricidamnosum NBRC 102515 = DSM 9628]